MKLAVAASRQVSVWGDCLTSHSRVGYMWRHRYGESLVILLLPPPTHKSSDNSAHVLHSRAMEGILLHLRDGCFASSLTGTWLLSQHPAKCKVIDEAPKLSSRDLFECCRVRAMQHYGSCERWQWSNGGMTWQGKTEGLRKNKKYSLNKQLQIFIVSPCILNST